MHEAKVWTQSWRVESVALRIEVTRKQHFPEALEEPLLFSARKFLDEIAIGSPSAR